MPKKIIFIAILLALGAVVSSRLVQSRLTLPEYAAAVMDKCADASYTVGCYTDEIPKLMDEGLSMEQAFAVTSLVQEQDSRLLYCHVLAHKLSYQEAEKSPNAWKDVVTRCPTTACNNGCLHGALMERFAEEILSDDEIEILKPDLLDVCEPRGDWHPVEVERSMCYHGLGHLFMYITDADFDRSLALCEFAGRKSDGRDYLQTCSQGVFMTIYQPLEPEDFALVRGLTPQNFTERDALCGKFSGLYWESCMTESWAMSSKQIASHDPSAVKKVCAYAKVGSELERKCYHSILGMIATVLLVDNDDSAAYEKFCLQIPKNLTGGCFGFGALRLLQIDPKLSPKARLLCESALESGYGKECYELLLWQARQVFRPASAELRDFCEALPESQKDQCLQA